MLFGRSGCIFSQCQILYFSSNDINLINRKKMYETNLDMDLTEVINSIDDITDPTAMEKILMYVNYIQAQDEEFIELLMEKLPYMEISWEQPWYQKSKSLTRPVIANNDGKEIFRNDKITETESLRIHKNWRKFRKHFDIPDNPECFARWKNTSKSRNPHTPEERVRRFVVAYLARGLERTLYQVFKHVVTRYGCPAKGNYSLQEEKLMEVCFYHNARNAIPLLSKVLGRESRGIYKKLHEWLNGQDDGTRMKWKLPLATRLLQLLIKHTGLPYEELKHKRFDKSIWIKIQEEMNHPYMYLQKFWYNKLHVQIYVKKDIKINKVRKKIARKLQVSTYKVWSDIRWKELLKEFPDGFTDAFLYRVWANIFRTHKNFLKMPLEEIIEYALNKIPLLPNRRLRTLAVNEDGELEQVRYEKDTS